MDVVLKVLAHSLEGPKQLWIEHLIGRNRLHAAPFASSGALAPRRISVPRLDFREYSAGLCDRARMGDPRFEPTHHHPNAWEGGEEGAGIPVVFMVADEPAYGVEP